MGGVAGGIAGAVIGVVDAGLSLKDLADGDPTEECCDILKARLFALYSKYAVEPEHAAREQILQDFALDSGKIAKKIEDLRWNIINYHRGTCGGRTIGGTLSAAGSGFLIAAAAPEPASPAFLGIGIGLGAAGALLGGSTQVAKSRNGYAFRGRLIDLVDEVVQCQQAYARATNRLSLPSGKPGRFSFKVEGVKEIYMTVTYITEGSEAQRMSCDIATNTWSEGIVAIEPGARDIQVFFNTRCGRPVQPVDRTQEGFPWKEKKEGKCYEEVFKYPFGDDLDVDFNVKSGKFFPYVGSCSMEP